MKYSIVIPVYNEAGNLVRLHERIAAVVPKLGNTEVLYVDDGSRDASIEELRSIAASDSSVRVIRFGRNFGQTAAMAAGFEHATGDVIIPMDADLQNDPADIPMLVAKLAEGYDVVSGWRKNRQDDSLRTVPSKIANKLIAQVTGVAISDYGCSLKAYRRDVLDGVRLYGEMHRFIPAYAAWNGGRVTEVEVSHHPRTVGSSKYTIWRTFKVILDLLVVKFLTTYFSRPMHFFGIAGFISIFVAGAAFMGALILKFGYGVSFILTPLPLLSALFFIVGVQFVLMGIIAEMVTRTYYESQGKSTYRIAEKINF
jgi:glycosyltransferase involved in cell wall biosynthesis